MANTIRFWITATIQTGGKGDYVVTRRAHITRENLRAYLLELEQYGFIVMDIQRDQDDAGNPIPHHTEGGKTYTATYLDHVTIA